MLRVFRLLYALTKVVLLYYSSPALSNDRSILLFRLAVAEYSVFCLLFFVVSALHGGYCAAKVNFCGVE